VAGSSAGFLIGGFGVIPDGLFNRSPDQLRGEMVKAGLGTPTGPGPIPPLPQAPQASQTQVGTGNRIADALIGVGQALQGRSDFIQGVGAARAANADAENRMKIEAFRAAQETRVEAQRAEIETQKLMAKALTDEKSAFIESWDAGQISDALVGRQTPGGELLRARIREFIPGMEEVPDELLVAQAQAQRIAKFEAPLDKIRQEIIASNENVARGKEASARGDKSLALWGAELLQRQSQFEATLGSKGAAGVTATAIKDSRVASQELAGTMAEITRRFAVIKKDRPGRGNEDFASIEEMLEAGDVDVDKRLDKLEAVKGLPNSERMSLRQLVSRQSALMKQLEQLQSILGTQEGVLGAGAVGIMDPRAAANAAFGLNSPDEE